MRREDGFTIVEVLVAITILSVGALGTLKALDSGQRLSHSTQRNQQAVAYVQRRIEELAARTWATLGMTATPAAPSAPAPGSPESFIAAGGTRFLIPADPRRPAGLTATGVGASGEPFVVAGPAGIDPAPQTVTIGNTTARLHRFVTQVDRCTTVEAATRCATSDTLRRITVAVVLGDTARDAARAPVWASTIVANPAPNPLDL